MVPPKPALRQRKKIDVSHARREFADLLSRVGYGRDRVVLCRNGKEIVAIIPLEDLQFLESLEDEYEVAACRRALAKSKFYSSAQARRKLGIKKGTST